MEQQFKDLNKFTGAFALAKSRVQAKSHLNKFLVDKSNIDFIQIAKKDLMIGLIKEAFPLLHSGIKQTENHQFETIEFELEAYVFTEDTLKLALRHLITTMSMEKIIDIRNEHNSSII